MEIALKKAHAMEDVIKACGDSKVLEFVDTPLADASTACRTHTSLAARYGAAWTTEIAGSINESDVRLHAASLSRRLTGQGQPAEHLRG